MRTILRPLAAGALAALVLTAHPAAQLLTTSEVKALMANKQPEDHTRLVKHFEALAVRYAADAERHKAFAQSAGGASRGAGVAAVRHHQKMAELAAESAKVTTELAMHHSMLAAGHPSTAPLGAEAFEAGKGAPTMPSERRLMVLAARAERPSEHGELYEYYSTLARQYESNAKDHRFMAQMYRGRSHPSEPEAVQCDRLAMMATGSAREARALALDHKELATGKKPDAAN